MNRVARFPGRVPLARPARQGGGPMEVFDQLVVVLDQTRWVVADAAQAVDVVLHEDAGELPPDPQTQGPDQGSQQGVCGAEDDDLYFGLAGVQWVGSNQDVTAGAAEVTRDQDERAAPGCDRHIDDVARAQRIRRSKIDWPVTRAR